MRIILIVIIIFISVGVSVYYFFTKKEYTSKPLDTTAPRSLNMNERIELTTKDNVKIVGDYYPAEGSRQGVLLLHMMPRDRKSWVVFAEKLQRSGLPVLAIDLRGHGESQGGPDGYKSFSDTQHQDSRLDVLAGALFLRSKQVDEFHLIGASIGANLALQYASEHPNARSAILLSPGIEYRGLKTMGLIENVPPSRGIFLVASDDDEYSRDSVNELASRITLDEHHKLKIFESGGHGTNIFENHPEFMDELVEWLKQF